MSNIDTGKYTSNDELPQVHPACRSLIKHPQGHPARSELKAAKTTNSPNVDDLKPFLREMIASPPRAGGGLHVWLFNVARQLHAHRTEQEIFDLLKIASEGRGRAVPDNEIRAAVKNSRATAWQPGQKSDSTPISEPKWPQPDYDFIRQEVITSEFNVLKLQKVSPVAVAGLTTQDVLPQLYPGDPLMTVGSSTYQFTTDHLSKQIAIAHEQSLIVPSSCVAREGPRRDGTGMSEHALSIVGARQYLVLETDFNEDGAAREMLAYAKEKHGLNPLDVAACVIEYLAQFLPTLALVVHSGKKSLHAYCNVADLSSPDELNGTDELFTFMQGAVIAGCDHRTWSRSQFVRMPGGMRRDKYGAPMGPQSILFYNPNYSLSHATL